MKSKSAEVYQNHIKLKIELEIILKQLERQIKGKKNDISTKAKHGITFCK